MTEIVAIRCKVRQLTEFRSQMQRVFMRLQTLVFPITFFNSPTFLFVTGIDKSAMFVLIIRVFVPFTDTTLGVFLSKLVE